MKLRMTNRCIGFLLFLAVIALSQRGFANPLSNVTYHVHQCTTVDPCQVTQTVHGSTPSGNYLAGFTQQAFQTFYYDHIQSYRDYVNRGGSDPLNIGIRGTNIQGYVYGNVWGPGAIYTQFIFYNGTILCCLEDEPFVITDLNDNGIFTGGYGSFGGAFLASTPAGSVNAPPEFLPNLDAASQQLLQSMDYSLDWTFLAIDNNNAILAENTLAPLGQRLYEFDPVPSDPAPSDPVPEPSGLSLDFPWVVGLLVVSLHRRELKLLALRVRGARPRPNFSS